VPGRPATIINVTPVLNTPKGTVTITGTGFNASPTGNIVFFGTTMGRVVSGTTTSLTVNVPLGTSYDFVTVLDSASKLYATYHPKRFLPFYDSSAMIPSTLFNVLTPFTIPLQGGRGASASGVVAYSMDMADLNNDGRPDIMVCGTGHDSVYVYRNIQGIAGSVNGATYAAPVAFKVDAAPFNVKAADLNADGKPEIILASAGTGAVSVLLNTTATAAGTVSFAPVFRIPSVGVFPVELAVADYDNDGRKDIAVVCRGLDGAFAPSVAVVRNNYNGLAGGTMSSSSFSVNTIAGYTLTADQPLSITAADFNGDNLADLAVTDQKHRIVSIYQNSSTPGTISFPARAGAFDIATDTVIAGTRSGFPGQVRTADLNNDGFPELVVAVTDSQLSAANIYNKVLVFENLHTSTTLSRSSFGSKYEITADTGTLGLAIGDLNGDKMPDIVATNASSGSISIALHNGASTAISFDTARTFLVDNVSSAVSTNNWGPVTVAIGDIDTNTVNDIAVVTQAQNVLSLFRLFPVPDTTPITGAHTICAADSTLLVTSHRVGSRGYWSNRTGNAAFTPIAGTDTAAHVFGLHPGADTLVYTIVALYDTNRMFFPITVVGRPDSGNITSAASRFFCSSDTLTLNETVTGGTWASTDATVAVIDAAGRVTYSGPGSGSTVISYTVSNGVCTSS
ncbi:MAG: hypothetical protein EBZ77_12350, partial [Chitinophagia bacterium]|nr:hypothetical protein [Chitinophagia bacterium]